MVSWASPGSLYVYLYVYTLDVRVATNTLGSSTLNKIYILISWYLVQIHWLSLAHKKMYPWRLSFLTLQKFDLIFVLATN